MDFAVDTVTLLADLGVPVETIGDSTGRLSTL